MPTRKTVVW